MEDNQKFVIDDITKFIESTRVLVFDAFGKTKDYTLDDLSILLSDLADEEIEELNQMLTQDECVIMSRDFIKTRINKKTKNKTYTIDTKTYMKMIECFNSRMVSNMLNNLVNRGLLETAYDTECNDFVFWVKEKDSDDKTET
jgi:hypothetical protein